MGHIWRLLTCILDRTVLEGKLTENPARAYQYPAVRQVNAETLNDQEMEDYLEAAEGLGYLPIFLLALEQGLRQRELIALKWSDLNIKARTLTVHEKRSIEYGKPVEYGDKTRRIDLPQFAVEQLIQEHEKHPSSEAMFIHPGTLKPYSPEMIRLLHKRVLKRARLKHISFKNLRHTCAVRALETGQDERKLSTMLGHTRTSVTQRGYREYLDQTGRREDVSNLRNTTEEKMRQAADKLEQLFTI